MSEPTYGGIGDLRRQQREQAARIRELEAENAELRGEDAPIGEATDEQLMAEMRRRQELAAQAQQTAEQAAANQRINDLTSGAEVGVFGSQDAIAEMKAIPLLNAAGDGFNPNARAQLRDLVVRNGGAIAGEKPGRWLKGGPKAVGEDGASFPVTTPER